MSRRKDETPMPAAIKPALAVNPNLIEMQYAVRGPVPMRAAELKRQGKRTIACNIGNPQALGQRPLTFFRQVLSMVEEPAQIGRSKLLKSLLAGGAPPPGADDETAPIPDDAIELAESILTRLEVGLGSYSESKGPLFYREAIARHIDRRDDVASSGGPTADPERIFLTNGASEGAKNMLEVLISNPRDGVMIPVPQYPLYSATIRRRGGIQVSYYPDEDNDWAFDRSMLEERLAAAEKDGVNVKGIVVINPGNPTGAIIDREVIDTIIDFAEDHQIVIIADEVYQENVYGAEFVSFAKALGNRPVALVSLHSVSKGFYGESGHRGGYLELRNPPRIDGTEMDLVDLLLKVASVNLCPNTVGQLLTFLMVSRPLEGSESYARFMDEKRHILSELADKATIIRRTFDEMDSVECFGRIGAMYLFPRLGKLPPGKTDFDYCMALLEETGITTVPGSGFGQREGTSHLRIAFLPPKELLEQVLPEWIAFHNRYVNGK
jgi:aspartate/methionine/tyrosine aminotransferase